MEEERLSVFVLKEFKICMHVIYSSFSSFFSQHLQSRVHFNSWAVYVAHFYRSISLHFLPELHGSVQVQKSFDYIKLFLLAQNIGENKRIKCCYYWPDVLYMFR